MSNGRRSTVLWAVVAAGLVASTAGGQQQIYQGNVLDANNRLGSGGLNQPRPAYDFNASNRIVTGNVAGGMSFRGYSPIRDPGAFFLGSPVNNSIVTSGSVLSGGSSYYSLPTDRLNSFQRDSFSMLDYRRGQAGWGTVRPYYSQSSTVLNTGAIVAGQNRIGTSQVQNPYQTTDGLMARPTNNLLNTVMESSASGNLLAVPSQVVRATTGQPVVGNVDYRVLASPLFAGAFQRVSMPEIAAQVESGQGLAAASPAAPTASGGETISMAPTGASQVPGPLDLRLNQGPQDLRVNREVGGRRPTAPTDPALRKILERAEADGDYFVRGSGASRINPRTVANAGTPAEVPAVVAAPADSGRLETAGDVYGWMIQAGQPASTGGPTAVGPGGLVPGGLAGEPGLAEVTNIDQLLGSQAMAEEASVVPLKTFVGTEASAVNQHMKYAEEAMSAGRYYRAAEAYELAQTVAPDNPLPALGRCMALLAAGDYMTSVGSIFAAIRMFESLGDFEVDLKAFVPDMKILDRRRADLEKRLDVKEDGRLRFLLGFAEYNSGLKTLGLANLSKAAGELTDEQADVKAVQRFVESLKVRTTGKGQPVDLPRER